MSIVILPKTSERAPLSRCKPSRDQLKMSDDGDAFVSMTAPFFAHILYSEMAIVFTPDVPWAATDAHSIFINPDGMEAEGWGIEEVAFVKCHEIMHYVRGDLLLAIKWRLEGTVFTGTRTLPYDAELMNRAADYLINAALIEARIGKMPMKDGRPFGCYDPNVSAKGMEDLVVIYDKLYKLREAGADRGGDRFDEHLEPSKGDQEREARIGEHRRQQVIAAAVQAQEASGLGMGSLPSVVRRLVGEVLDPKVRWQDHLHATMAHAAGEPRCDPRSINKRMISRPVGGRIIAAARSKYGCGTVAIGWDTSGSTHRFQEAFFAEMAGIVAELNPERLIVIRCDARVHAVNELDQPSDLEELKQEVNKDGIGGGGGTRFAPVFQWLEDNDIEPDMLVYLTDLEGSFPPREPHYPTIWANIKPGKKAPFGTIVEIEL